MDFWGSVTVAWVIDLILPFAVTSPQIPNRGWPCSGDLKKQMSQGNQCPSPHDRPYPAKNTFRVRNTFQQTPLSEQSGHVTTKSCVEYATVLYKPPTPKPKKCWKKLQFLCVICTQKMKKFSMNIFEVIEVPTLIMYSKHLKVIFLILFTSSFISKYYTCQTANQSYSFQIRK